MGELRYGAVIAVPAASEAARIEACLSALEADAGRDGDVAVFVFANNCRDDTAARARAFAAASRLPVHVCEATLPPARAHAGAARRDAMAWAASHLREGRDTLILTTDADSRVRPGWLAGVRRAMAAGADAVCGTVEFCPMEAAGLTLPDARRLEARYAVLQAQVDSALDPRAHDPWPNHLWAWGANLAVRADLHARVGGLPETPLAEDRAFMARLELEDARIRHALDVRVVTSARRDGRAAGGLASLVGLYATDADHPCDAALEPILSAADRAQARRRLRSARMTGRAERGLATALALRRDALARALDAATFGRAWALVERESRTLSHRERLVPARLPLEIARAERLLARLSPGGGADPADSALAEGSSPWSAALAPPG